jgi:hypothetical protein
LQALLRDGRDELSHRLALRAAVALSTCPENPWGAKPIDDLVRAVYRHRSAVVHGDVADRYRTVSVG